MSTNRSPLLDQLLTINPANPRAIKEARIIVSQYLHHKLNTAAFKFHPLGKSRQYGKEAQQQLQQLLAKDLAYIAEREERGELKHLAKISQFFNRLMTDKFIEYNISEINHNNATHEEKINDEVIITIDEEEKDTHENYLHQDQVLARLYYQDQDILLEGLEKEAELDVEEKEANENSENLSSHLFSHRVPKDLIYKILELTGIFDGQNEQLTKFSLINNNSLNLLVQPYFWKRLLKRDFGYISMSENVEHAATLKEIYVRLLLLEKRNPEEFRTLYYSYLSPSNRGLYPPLESVSLPASATIDERKYYFLEALRLGNLKLVKWLGSAERGDLRIVLDPSEAMKLDYFRGASIPLQLCLQSGSIEQMKWAFNLGGDDASVLTAPESYLLEIVKSGHLQTTRWFYKTYCQCNVHFLANSQLIEAVLKSRSAPLIHWLEKTLKEAGILYFEKACRQRFDLVLLTGSKSLVERFVINQPVPSSLDSSTANKVCCVCALKSKNKQVVDLYEPFIKDFRESQDPKDQALLADKALASGNLSLVQMSIPNNLPFTIVLERLETACFTGNIMLVKWLLKDMRHKPEQLREIKRNQSKMAAAFCTAIASSNLELVKWFHDTLGPFVELRHPSTIPVLLKSTNPQLVKWLLNERYDLQEEMASGELNLTTLDPQVLKVINEFSVSPSSIENVFRAS